MYPDKEVEESMCGSQNFCLKLSQDSTVSETFGTNDDNDIVIISDSSSKSTCSGPQCTFKSASKKYSMANRTIYIMESSDSDSTDIENEKLFKAWKANKKPGFIKLFHERKGAIERNKKSFTSDESSSSDAQRIRNCIINSNKADSSSITATTGNNVKSTSKSSILSPTSNTMNGTNLLLNNAATTTDKSNSKSSNKIIQQTKTPSSVKKAHSNLQRDLSRKDAKSIIKNINSSRITYESPSVQKQNNSVFHKDDDIIHPAISPTNNLPPVNTIIDETLVDSESDVVLGSQLNVVNPYETHISKFIKSPYVENDVGYTELSERKKKQISQWLMANSPDSQSDNSLSIVPPSSRNDISSGNSSLERLEMNYVTPNNRDKIRQQQMSEKTIKNSSYNRTPHTVVQKQSTINDYVQKSKTNGLELSTSTKKNHTKSSMFSSTLTEPRMDTPRSVNIQDCADILDKLYGKSWREKANVLFANSEPRKQNATTINRAVQTERKLVSKEKLYISDADDDCNTSVDNLKIQNPSRKKKVKQNGTKKDSFIYDNSTSESGCESLYLTALTNPRISTNEQSEPIIPPTLERVRRICDTDTENEEDDKNNWNQVSDIRGRKLSFSDDESDDSGTSEFDPGDDVPPKPTINKGQITKPNNQIKSVPTTTKYEKHKSFLESLSESVPIVNVHPDAKKYRENYKNNKQSLCNYLYKLYNEKVFDNNLPKDMLIEWNVRMRGTAGYCYNKKTVKTIGGIGKSSRIVLATKILDTPDRLRDTLIHEMCHAAAWLINDVSDGHGPFWTGWANKAMKVFPELPQIRRCHDYKIKTKFTYKCIGCGYSIGRHSKSLDIERKRCGHCYGKFELLINKTTKTGTVQVQTPKREPTAFALYVKENYNSVKKEYNIKHGEVMKILGQQFSAIKIAKKRENNENDPDTFD